MNTHPGHPAPPIAPEAPSAATARLAQSRARMAVWLTEQRAHQARPSLAGWAASAAWPLIRGLGEHPSALLALGALARGLQRPPESRPASAPPAPVGPRSTAFASLSLVRTHPRSALALLAIVGTWWWWNHRSSARPPTR